MVILRGHHRPAEAPSNPTRPPLLWALARVIYIKFPTLASRKALAQEVAMLRLTPTGQPSVRIHVRPRECVKGERIYGSSFKIPSLTSRKELVQEVAQVKPVTNRCLRDTAVMGGHQVRLRKVWIWSTTTTCTSSTKLWKHGMT